MLGMAFSLVSWMIVHLDEIRFSHVSHMGALSLHLHSPPHSLCRRPNKVPNSKRLQRFQPIFPSLCWMCTNKRHSRHSIGSEFIKNVQYSTISPGLSAVTYVTNYDFSSALWYRGIANGREKTVYPFECSNTTSLFIAQCVYTRQFEQNASHAASTCTVNQMCMRILCMIMVRGCRRSLRSKHCVFVVHNTLPGIGLNSI